MSLLFITAFYNCSGSLNQDCTKNFFKTFIDCNLDKSNSPVILDEIDSLVILDEIDSLVILDEIDSLVILDEINSPKAGRQ